MEGGSRANVIMQHSLPPCRSTGVTSPESSGDATDIDALIQHCLSGDQAAWQTVVRMHRRKVFNIAYKFVGSVDQAEDLTQDVFIKLFRSLHTFDRRANFQTWLYSVTRNLCIDHYRALRKEREALNRDLDIDVLAPASTDRSPHQLLEAQDQATLLRRALQRLPTAMRTAVVLRDLRELSYEDIARTLDLPDGTVKSRISRGRAELARQVRAIRDEDAARLRAPLSSSDPGAPK
jgi:RNA polymerase sigma-70 factor, ECF subfamily